MVLAHLGRDLDYNRLLKLLQVKAFGTPGRNLKNLRTLGMEVIYREGSLDEIKGHLLDGRPCIALVRTAELAYWTYSTDHAIVVVGFDENTRVVAELGNGSCVHTQVNFIGGLKREAKAVTLKKPNWVSCNLG